MVLQFPQKKTKHAETAFVLKKKRISSEIHEIKKKIETNHPIKISADNALALLIENGFTKQQYNKSA